eukprot:5953603-Pyramimonas_sp.AAC.1
MYLLHVSLGPFRYLSDCKWAVSSLRKGREATTGSMCMCADLRRRAWGRVDDLGREVEVIKVKGHAL